MKVLILTLLVSALTNAAYGRWDEWRKMKQKRDFSLLFQSVMDQAMLKASPPDEPVDSTYGASRTCNGDITKLFPTGKKPGGVPASEALVKADVAELEKRRSYYQSVADQFCIQASVVGAVASRESGAGRLLYKTGGWGDHHRAWGILQCDIKHSDLPCLNCDWDSLCHIKMMIQQSLIPKIKQVQKKFPFWTADQALQGGVAAYNFGVSNVRSWANLDVGTTGGDYSNDVIARAKYLYSIGWN